MVKKKGSLKKTSGKHVKPRLHLRRGEAISDGLKTVANLQLEAAIEVLQGNNVFPEPVHLARTYIKKTRAIVRLATPALGSSRRDHLLDLLHEAAYRLAPLRESEVQVESLDLLLESDGLQPEDYSGIRDGLADIAKQRRTNDARQIPRVIDFLKKTLRTVPEWPIEPLEGKDLRRRIRRIYRRGRMALELCSLNDSPELFHTWRKLVKELWYALQITAKYCLEDGSKVIAELETIGELAGKERDFSLLAECLRHGPKNKHSAGLLSIIGEKLPKLRERALAGGNHFYERKPKVFIELLDL